MPNAEQDRQTLARELQVLLDAYAGEQADAAELGERPDLWDHVIEVPVSIVRGALAALRAPAATDTAGAVEREFAIEQKVRKVGGRYQGPGIVRGHAWMPGDGYWLYVVGMQVAGGDGEFAHVFPAAAIRALPITPDDPAAGDGGGR